MPEAGYIESFAGVNGLHCWFSQPGPMASCGLALCRYKGSLSALVYMRYYWLKSRIH